MYSSRRSGLPRSTSFAQIAADSLTLFLWYCTQCERVWMDCWLSDSFSSLLLNELAEKPAIKGSRARQRCGLERGAGWLAGGGRHGPGSVSKMSENVSR